MTDHRIRVDSRQITLLLANGNQFSGEIFLHLHAFHHAGPQRVAEVLNGDENFLPVKTEKGVSLVNLDQVVAVATLAEGEFDPMSELGEKYDVRVTSVVGESLDAKIFVNLPHQSNRSKDFLNQERRFLPFLAGEQIHYVARKMILLVED